MRRYRVMSKKGMKGPYRESTILEGVRTGVIPMGARLELMTTGRLMYAREVLREAEIREQATLSLAEKQQSVVVAPQSSTSPGSARRSKLRNVLSRRVLISGGLACSVFVAISIVALAVWPSKEESATSSHVAEQLWSDSGDERNVSPSPAQLNLDYSLKDEVAKQREELGRLRRQLDQDAEARARLEMELAGAAKDVSVNKDVDDPEHEVESLPDFSDYVESFNTRIFLIYTEIPIWDGNGVQMGTYSGVGTGWLVERGLIVTNKHVLFSFLFDKKRCSALEWLVSEAGWKLDAEAGIIAAFPTGSISPRSESATAAPFAPARVHDGSGDVTSSRGRLHFAGALPDVLRTVKSSIGATEVSTNVHDSHSANDLVLLRIVGGGAESLIPLPLATVDDLASLRQLDEVMTIGFPRGLDVSRGRVLQTSPATGRIRHYDPDRHVIVTSASTHAGNSGGPMVSRSGKVIGVVTRGFDSDLNESIDAQRVRDLLDPLLRVTGQEYFEGIRVRFSPKKQRTPTANGREAVQGDKPESKAQYDGDVQVSWLNSWRNLRIGMTSERVKEVLGEPGEKGEDSISLIWRYPDRGGARVYYDKEDYLVRRWTTPWSRLRKGMTQAQVERLLRAPSYTAKSRRNEPIWFYRFDADDYGILFDAAGKLAYHNFPDK